MRTTVTIDDNLLTAARRVGQERGQSLGRVIEDSLRRTLAEADGGEPVSIPVFPGGGGTTPGVNLRSNRALHEYLDEPAGSNRTP